MTLKELKDEKRDLSTKIDGLRSTIQTEKRDMTAEELTDVRTWRTRRDQLDDLIEEETRALEDEAKRKKDVRRDVEKPTPEAKLANQFSVVRAIRAIMDNQKLTGAEAEVNQEGQTEMRDAGLSSRGNLQIPGFVAFGLRTLKTQEAEQRDLQVGTATAGPETVEQDLRGLIPVLRPRLTVEGLGATMFRNVSGDLDFPRNDLAGIATFKTEIATADEATQTFDTLELRPKRLTAWSEFSRQLMYQSSIDIENFVRADLTMAVAEGIDKAAIQGSGVGPIPLGIINDPTVTTVTEGATGVIAWPDVVALETAVETALGNRAPTAYLSNPYIKGVLKSTLKVDASGSQGGMFIWQQYPGEMTGEMNGVAAVATTHVPAAHLIYGWFPALYIAQWGGVSLIVDPYTQAKNAQIVVTVDSYWDTGLRWGQHFAILADGPVPAIVQAQAARSTKKKD